MKLNRILVSIAAWLNSLAWWREGQTRIKPYEIIETSFLEERGVLMLVRRDERICPRDVGTIMWMPSRASHPNARDIHICIDSLDGMARRRGHTHQVSILSASHWPDKDGMYDYDPLFHTTADLQGQQPRPDLHVKCLLTELADVFRYPSPELINWSLQFDIARKVCMRGRYNGPPADPLPIIRGRRVDP
ncbi:MAG: hypothetical protein DCF32_22860 [Leptolyngbya sp.]|nr:MAG: hypothetical protein DCF32_22860 [Leptolyngbya sp.]